LSQLLQHQRASQDLPADWAPYRVDRAPQPDASHPSRASVELGQPKLKSRMSRDSDSSDTDGDDGAGAGAGGSGGRRRAVVGGGGRWRRRVPSSHASAATNTANTAATTPSGPGGCAGVGSGRAARRGGRAASRWAGHTLRHAVTRSLATDCRRLLLSRGGRPWSTRSLPPRSPASRRSPRH